MARRKRGRPVHGWIVIDKPAGMTSSQVVGRVRRLLDAQKAGHGGTLDPLATGVLPVALGEATKTVSYVMDGRKRYRFTLKWGVATDTDDAEGRVIETAQGRPGRDEIEAVLDRFLGEIEQVPPHYSAVKVAGRRAYDLARSDEAFELEPRRVQIRSLRLVEPSGSDGGLGAAGPELASFEVECGKGTYMRSLARDLGRALGTAAHIVALRRLAVGRFDESHAISLESLETLGHSAAASGHVHPVESALDDIPALPLTSTEASRLRSGQTVSFLTRHNQARIQDVAQGTTVCAMSDGKPVALARLELSGLRPVRVLNL